MREAGEALRLTAQDLIELGVCDMIINEPVGGAHRNKKAAITGVGAAINTMLKQMDAMSPDELRQTRRQKYLDLGAKGLAA